MAQAWMGIIFPTRAPPPLLQNPGSPVYPCVQVCVCTVWQTINLNVKKLFVKPYQLVVDKQPGVISSCPELHNHYKR